MWLHFYITVEITALFLVYPNVCKSVFSMVSCRKLGRDGDPSSYLMADLALQCWDVAHTAVVVALFVPMFVVYVVGIPAMGFLYLRRDRANLMSPHMVDQEYEARLEGYRTGNLELQVARAELRAQYLPGAEGLEGKVAAVIMIQRVRLLAVCISFNHSIFLLTALVIGHALSAYCRCGGGPWLVQRCRSAF